MAFIASNFAPIMFVGLILFLLLGFPVAFSLGAAGMFFGLLGVYLDIFPSAILSVLPLRLIGIMANETLLAVPFFTLMGLILERSGMAEDLLESIGQVFGPLRGGLALAVVLVGAMLAATTGVVAASVISMGLISMPIMLRYGYSRSLASGVIAASGTLAQIIPPSLVLIVLADQMGKSVGDMYKGAFIPGFTLMGLYILFVFALAIFRPKMVPALPPEARTFREPSGRSGYLSLTLLALLSTAVAVLLGKNMAAIHTWWQGELVEFVPTDEKIVVAMCGGSFFAWLIAVANRVTHLGLLSKLAERVTFVLIPPLLLIFLVLGTIFLGVATPTEGGAMGAMGALIMAVMRKRLSWALLRQALDTTTKLASFVMFILIGATVFSMVFQAADGPVWVEHLLAKLPGGQLGFLIFVNVLVFFLAFFLDFFELSFIVVPVLAPIADKMGIDLIWFGVLLAVNMQTSFLHPPFGFALFYLRSVAPEKPYVDSHTGKTMEPVTTMQIYKGAIPFLLLQLSMVAILIAFPALVTGGLDKQAKVDMKAVGEQMLHDLDQNTGSDFNSAPALPGSGSDAGQGSQAPANGSGLPGAGDEHSGPAGGEAPDPMKAIQDAIGK
ncbi:MAG: TRAP transporter large permease subunit [Burkholderiaceae bacterium]|nr:TRAP transporter large permease subunit [Pseudomonadota bacterium]MBS0598135.1 TRAP transporter large permease subunit [Pseudomonadota bacterium]MCO5116030.1 TRAP transporter large permease subunit [Burkholderiaceae bacterium]MCP5219850.1 TRAP transporter large permease subunit [Burkholderiaceae bacterium]